MIWAHAHEPPPRIAEIEHPAAEALDDVIARAMAKTPAERFSRRGRAGRRRARRRRPAARAAAAGPAARADRRARVRDHDRSDGRVGSDRDRAHARGRGDEARGGKAQAARPGGLVDAAAGPGGRSATARSGSALSAPQCRRAAFGAERPGERPAARAPACTPPSGPGATRRARGRRPRRAAAASPRPQRRRAPFGPRKPGAAASPPPDAETPEAGAASPPGDVAGTQPVGVLRRHGACSPRSRAWSSPSSSRRPPALAGRGRARSTPRG